LSVTPLAISESIQANETLPENSLTVASGTVTVSVMARYIIVLKLIQFTRDSLDADEYLLLDEPGFRVESGHFRRRVIVKVSKVLILLVALTLFAAGGCIGSDSIDDAGENTSGTDAEQQDVDVEISASTETSSSSEEDSEYDPLPTDINYDNLDAGIPEGFPDVIPVYDPATVLGGIGQDAGGTMIYNLVLGTDDQISDVADVIVGSVENIDMSIAVEGSTLLMGYMGDWDYTITIDNGEADGFTTVITYSIVERQ